MHNGIHCECGVNKVTHRHHTVLDDGEDGVSLKMPPLTSKESGEGSTWIAACVHLL